MSNLSDYGVRQFLNLLISLLTYYGRHKVNIDPNLTPMAKSFLEGLYDMIDAFRAMNPEGPDPVVPNQTGGGL